MKTETTKYFLTIIAAPCPGLRRRISYHNWRRYDYASEGGTVSCILHHSDTNRRT